MGETWKGICGDGLLQMLTANNCTYSLFELGIFNMKYIKELVLLLVIVLFILFLNINEASLHAVTKKMNNYTQKINQYIKTMNYNNNSKTIYTLQTGSFIKSKDAQKEYVSITNGWSEKNLDYLRIEKVGKFYTVRLGKFEDSAAAEKFLQAINRQLPTVVILKAYIKKERIIRSYGDE